MNDGNIKKTFNKSFFLALFLLELSCSNSANVSLEKKNIHFDKFEKALLTGGSYTGINILKTYLNEDTCNSKKMNANLYICINVRNGDTLYVFDVCDKAAWFATANLAENFAILHEDVKNNIPQEVIIHVPKSFSIPNHAKYVFSKLTRLKD